MKRILCLLLSMILVCSTDITALGAEQEEYSTVSVEYSDKVGQIEQLEIMTKDGKVYVNAETVSGRLGYQFSANDECITIYNKDNSNIPFGVTQFFYDSEKVNHMIFNKMFDQYEAPFSSIKNDKGYWIPLEYSLLILNSGMLLLKDSILIDIPQKDIIDYYYDIMKNVGVYNFDWNKDFGYTDVDWKVLSASSHLVNIFNGLLDLDGASWEAMFQSFIMDSSAYNEKYGENIALLLCSEADEELKASIEKIELYKDIFSTDGQLGEMLTTYSDNIDSEVGALYENCEKILADVKNNNSSVVTYNKSYQALEDAFDKQTWFSNTGGNIIDIQKGLSDVMSILDIGMKIAEVVGYGNEFANQDEFSLSSLVNYLDSSTSSATLPKAMNQSMKDYTDILSSNMAEYSAVKFLKENIDGWVTEGLSLSEALGTQANVALFAWNIASNTVPFISNGLEGADKFELALYSQVFQSDTFLNYQNLRNSTFEDIDTFSPEKLYDVSQYCYLYLKSCYTARNAALGSLAGKSDSTKEKIQPLIDYQNNINHDIAKIMVELKTANKTNEGNVYGFLPSDNESYLKNFNDDKLIDQIENNRENTTYVDNVDEDTLKKLLMSYTSEELLNFIYDDFDNNGVYEAIAFCGDEEEGSYFGTLYLLTNQGVSIIREKDIYWNSGVVYDFGNAKIISITKYFTTGGISYYYQINGNEIVEIDGSGKGDGLFKDNGGRMCMTDSQYDSGVDGTGHTWNVYYFYWDNKLKEYGGTEISIEEFSKYHGSDAILNQISKDGFDITTIYKRDNGIININCCDGQSNKNVRVLLEGEDVKVLPVTEDYYEEGIIKQALIPEIATY